MARSALCRILSSHLVGQPLTVESDIVQGELKVTPQVGTMFRLVAIASFKLLSNETIDPKPDGMKIGGRPSAQVGAMFRLVAMASFKLLSNETIDPKPVENLAGLRAWARCSDS
jgi:hypothetical protein